MERNIMIAFVSLVNGYSLQNPIHYPDIMGEPYTAIQTNESAVVWIKRWLKNKPLDKLFLIVSKTVKEDYISDDTEFGRVTHKEFLEKRLLLNFPDLEGKFQYFDYSEGMEIDNSDVAQQELGQNLLEVANIFQGIQAYMDSNKEDIINVHADMTGGMRHASMMMLSIMQLLKYNGAKICEVLYSDQKKKQVYQANSIQRMFTLINGADEFSRFGSVNAIMEYFEPNKENLSGPLTELLEAMQHFSDSIKICSTNAILDEVKNLGNKIEIFQRTGGETLDEKIFSQMITTIQKDYDTLLKPNVNQIDIIKWCIKKEFWQQTLTLCTEWLPELLVDKKIAFTDNKVVIDACEKEGEGMSRSWKQDFIMTYKGISQKEKIAPIRNWLKLTAYNIHNKTEIERNLKKFPRLMSILLEYINCQKEYYKLQRNISDLNNFSNTYKSLYKALNKIYKKYAQNNNYKKTFASFITGMDYQKIQKEISELSHSDFWDLLEIEEPKPILRGSDKWNNRCIDYMKMMEDNILCSKCASPMEMMEFLHDYHEIKEIRNTINHASKEDKYDIKKISNKISMYLDELSMW